MTASGHLRSASHRVVVVGAGAAGSSVAHQLLRTRLFEKDDIAIVDPASDHHYQPGWTLVGGGIKNKEQLRKPLSSIIDSQLKYYPTAVESFSPTESSIQLKDQEKTLFYDQLVVAPGIEVKLEAIRGLKEALMRKDAPVSSIYDFVSKIMGCPSSCDILQGVLG